MKCPRPHCNGNLRLERGDVDDYGVDRLVCGLCGREQPMAMIQEERERMDERTTADSGKVSPLGNFNRTAERYLSLKQQHTAAVAKEAELRKQLAEARNAYAQEYAKLDTLLPRDGATATAVEEKPKKQGTGWTPEQRAKYKATVWGKRASSTEAPAESTEVA